MRRKKKWCTTDSAQLYNIAQWGEGLFGINQAGELTVSPQPDKGTISLYAIAQDLTQQGISLPILLRFPEILEQRVKKLNYAFAQAIKKEEYTGTYTTIYPIKVNQQHIVVNTLASTNLIGLEAGSKAEMMAILTLPVSNNTTIVCNGYKDREYIRLALVAQKLGLCSYIVIEKATEVKIITEEAATLNIVPQLGIRIRLASVGQGKWQDSGGEKAKFGLNAAQILDAIKLLRKEGLINSLKLMHFHVGSQIPNIHDIQKILTEAARFYAELHALNVPINVIDAGGGLGVDYEGSLSSRPFSRNYTTEEYADNIIYTFKEICKAHQLPHPDILTETGRAIAAYHSMLLTDIVNTELSTYFSPIRSKSRDDDPDIIKDLQFQLGNISPHSALEAYHNATYWLHEAHVMFSYGIITLEQRAHAEQLIHNTYLKVSNILKKKEYSIAHYEALDDLKDKLVDRYFVNFSLFSSAPDAWAIQQLFPIMPLHRLHEYPDRHVTLHDLTCDSDGHFDKYVHSHGFESHLPLHTSVNDEPYLIGIFLIGAYQESLSNLHNLFGTAHSVNVYTTEKGGYTISDISKGDSVTNMIKYFQYNTDQIQPSPLQKRLSNLQEDSEQRDKYIQVIEAALKNYTYFMRKNHDV
ncbi:MAG: biosynthetic arginine decarboxylase [Candidatus Electrothrix scaldis]|nr:MAG: biosynthetic arginine decarboxylase [Candidatus Electrothrix sp. GW3-3]